MRNHCIVYIKHRAKPSSIEKFSFFDFFPLNHRFYLEKFLDTGGGRGLDPPTLEKKRPPTLSHKCYNCELHPW